MNGQPQTKGLSAEDDAKLIFGTIFSLRNMAKKLGGQEDKYGPQLHHLVDMYPYIDEAQLHLLPHRPLQASLLRDTDIT